MKKITIQQKLLINKNDKSTNKKFNNKSKMKKIDKSAKMINQLDSLEKHLRSSPAATWPASGTFVLPTTILERKIYICRSKHILQLINRNIDILQSICHICLTKPNTFLEREKYICRSKHICNGCATHKLKYWYTTKHLPQLSYNPHCTMQKL